MYPNSPELVPNPDTRPCSKASPERSKVAKYTLKPFENPSVPNAATLSAKDMKHTSIKDAGVCHVFTKQRRDVQLMDAELRPVGNDAPLGFGSLVSTDCQTLGILRLQPGVAKSSSKSVDHDVV
ncbi:hypothetical protein HPB47_006557 [Ixodes persulcatus]|uniref:Uncharacterized protein n=1 Tax=Ixodes persulcatus TaxID=34615 RepID=A0AC60PAQ6_IXOPE|nr:hypothetical protein HPB47_006557 [Ixodes persulcatus]